MSSSASAYFTSELLQQKLLIVGAGGIGCELIKNLAMGGFQDIEVIDLDTIDPKAKVAAEAALAMRPGIRIVHHHDSIYNNKFDLAYFQQFAVVLNALDNLAARRHVNRLCISGNVPLIDGGTTGFLGQVRVIQRNVTDTSSTNCSESPTRTTTCRRWTRTRRRRRTEEDERRREDGRGEAEERSDRGRGRPKVAGTRRFAESVDYDPQQVYDQFFIRDIEYLLGLEHLWKDRRPPVPFRCEFIAELPQPAGELPSNQTWSLNKWIGEFVTSIRVLAKRVKEATAEGRVLARGTRFDDDASLRFVAACANIRAHIFHIAGKSLFDVKCKSMAGNIIPAIATSNAIIAGLMVVETYKVVAQRKESFQSSFIAPKPTPRGKILVNDAPVQPNPKCYVCAEKREVFVRLNVEQMKQRTFVNKILKRTSECSRPTSPKSIEEKELSKLSVAHGAQFDVDDFQQKFQFTLFVINTTDLDDEDFEVLRDSDSTKAAENGANGATRVFADDAARKRAAPEQPADAAESKRARVEAVEA
ncbi:SUMO-activating enzyme subunit [Aphelenchoides fujianensis]|nr:SUMO-activating enzyme subunit [Aphelenchoides fujianensis]